MRALAIIWFREDGGPVKVIETVPSSGSLCPLLSGGIDLQEAPRVKGAGLVEDMEGKIILHQVMGSGAVVLFCCIFLRYKSFHLGDPSHPSPGSSLVSLSDPPLHWPSPTLTLPNPPGVDFVPHPVPQSSLANLVYATTNL